MHGMNDTGAATLASEIEQRLRTAGMDLDDPRARWAEAVSVERYAMLVRTASWQELWPTDEGGERAVPVTAELWTAAIQAALDEHPVVRLPYRPQPYYIDAPLILHSGNRLYLDEGTEIRLKPGTNTCMARNEHVVSGQRGPVSVGVEADERIVITGGIWSTLATSHAQSNGNHRGRVDQQDSAPGAHGTILLHNVRNVLASDLTIRMCRPFGVQVGNCCEFCVQNIRYEDHRRDGVHVEGPAQWGIVRQLAGVTGDDMVALNAWDWRDYSVTFGPIHHVLVEGIWGCAMPEHTTGENPYVPDGTAEIRLLAGTKRFADGSSVDCDITDCVFRDIHNVRTCKMYDQPNIGEPDTDYADPIGKMVRLFFRDVHIGRATPEPTFQVAANIRGMSVRDVYLGFDPDADPAHPYKLIGVGPMSATYTFGQADPARWVELFSPDEDCTVEDLHVAGVQARPEGEGEWRAVEPQQLVQVISQTPNPDYPHTTPRGGTGKGQLLHPVFGE